MFYNPLKDAVLIKRTHFLAIFQIELKGNTLFPAMEPAGFGSDCCSQNVGSNLSEAAM